MEVPWVFGHKGVSRSYKLSEKNPAPGRGRLPPNKLLVRKAPKATKQHRPLTLLLIVHQN